MASGTFDIAGIESKMLENTIEEQKQMLKHLHRRVQDHLRERHDLIEMNEECEKVIKEKENKIKDVSNYHKKAREEYKDALATWEKKKDISNKLMKTLQNENATLKNRLEENIVQSEESKKLFDEINYLKEINNEKEKVIKQLEEESEESKSKLLVLEKE